MTGIALAAYVLCFVVCAICAVLLLRSWSRTRSRLVRRCGEAFVFLAISNAMLVFDKMSPVDLSIPRAAIIAIGLGLLVYGVTLEEQA